MADVFGRAQMIVEADDARLQSTLKKDEQLVRSSVNTMQTSFNSLTTTMGTSAAGAQDLQIAFTGVSTAASLSGSAAVATAANWGVLAASMKAAAAAALAAQVAIAGAVGTIATLGTAVAVGALAWLNWSTKTKKAKEELEELNAETARSDKVLAGLTATVARITAAEGALRKALFIAEGGSESGFLRRMKAEGQRGLDRQIALQQELEGLQKAKQLQQEAAERERFRLKLEKDLLNVRQKNLETQRAIAEQSRLEAVSIKQSRTASLLAGGRAPETRFEAETQLVRTLVQAATVTRGSVLKLEAAQRLVTGGFGPLAQIRQALGLGGADGQRASTRSIGAGAFAVSGLSAPTGAVRPVAAAAKAERRDDERNRLLKDIVDAIGLQLRLLGNGGLAP